MHQCIGYPSEPESVDPD
jgi:hypothetical protein